MGDARRLVGRGRKGAQPRDGGVDGILLAATALALSRQLGLMRPTRLRAWLAPVVSRLGADNAKKLFLTAQKIDAPADAETVMNRVVSLFRRSHGDRVFRGLLTIAAVIICPSARL